MNKLILSLLLAFTATAQWHSSPFPQAAPTSGYSFEQVWTNLDWSGPNRPQGFEVHNGSVYVICRYGRVWVVPNPGSAAPTRSLIIHLPQIFATGDSGFPGFVFHPDGQSIFTFTTETATNNGVVSIQDRVRRWPFNPSNPTASLSLASSTILLDQYDRSPEHAGGDMHFGPDGYLYISLGDEGGQGGVLLNGQRIDLNYYSGIIRVDVNNLPDSLEPNPHPAFNGGWKVPADNPWVGATSFNGSPVDPLQVRTEFWSVGLRNPTKFSFDTNGVIMATDVGGSRWESVRRITKGSNHGWNWYEGPEVVTSYAPQVSDRPAVSFTEPAWTYPHSAIAASVGWTDQRFIGNCIIGGMIYSGSKYPSLNGKYIFGDYTSKNVWSIGTGTNATVSWLGSHPSGLACAAVNPANGDILIGSFGDGKIWKMVQSAPSGVPLTLSSTGIFTNLATMEPSDGVLPYEVASPFWSDHAIKTRWFFLPPGGVIYRGTSDQWIFPVGSVWVKHFDLPYVRGFQEGRKVESRFTVKTEAGLYGLTYRWREDGSDADLVPEQGADGEYPVTDSGVDISQKWHWPSRSECITCHNPETGYVLGFSARQLNTTALAGEVVVDQLLALSQLGVFNTPYSSVVGVPRLSRPLDETATLEHRFKSYTDANCAYCHFPGGPGRGEWDARFSTPMTSSKIIGGSVIESFGVEGSSVITPGSTNRSVLFRRVADFIGDQHPAEYHMPPLATYQRNEAGISMIERYINSLTARSSWSIGLDDNRAHDFKLENASNPPAPGSPTTLDDDFYTSGVYPQGYNGLTGALVVPDDEPWLNWERALTRGNKVNRFHFVSQEALQASMSTEFYSVGSMIGGVVQPGYATHNLVIRHITGSSTNTIWDGAVAAPISLDVPINVARGPNTIEFTRTGPLASGTSYWMLFDYVKVE